MSSEPAPPRVLLVGLGPTTQSALDGLLGRFEVVALVRDGEDDVTAAAAAAGVPVVSVTGTPELADLVTRLGPDCVVVSSYHRILPGSVLDMCPFLNVHYAPLPRYRGRANVNWAILNGEAEAAVTVHTMVAGLDAGGVLAQQSVPIGARDTVGDLYRRLNDVQRRILPEAVRRRLDGELGAPQDESEATYGCTRVPDDGEIDWSASTDTVDRLIRALAEPYPGAFTYLRLRRLWVLEAEPSPDQRTFVGRVPGRLVGSSATQGWADILTGDGVMRVRRIRYDGETVPAATVLRGSRQTLGLRSSDLVDRIAELEDDVRGRSTPSDGAVFNGQVLDRQGEPHQ
jgi:methionyl-tRNA formyltransferase